MCLEEKYQNVNCLVSGLSAPSLRLICIEYDKEITRYLISYNIPDRYIHLLLPSS